MAFLTFVAVAVCMCVLPGYSMPWSNQENPAWKLDNGFDPAWNAGGGRRGRPNGGNGGHDGTGDMPSSVWGPRSAGAGAMGPSVWVPGSMGPVSWGSRGMRADRMGPDGRRTGRNGSRGMRPGDKRVKKPAQTQPTRPSTVSEKLPVPETYVNPQDAVAFSARKSDNQFFYKAGPVVFDDVITNIGGGYNSEYGVFTAPVPGIYTVHYHVASNPGSPKPANVDLLRNEEVINSAKASGDCVSGSNSAVLYLDQFDRVTLNGRAGSAIGCERNGLCSFSVNLDKLGKFTDQKVPRAFPVDKW